MKSCFRRNYSGFEKAKRDVEQVIAYLEEETS